MALFCMFAVGGEGEKKKKMRVPAFENNEEKYIAPVERQIPANGR